MSRPSSNIWFGWVFLFIAVLQLGATFVALFANSLSAVATLAPMPFFLLAAATSWQENVNKSFRAEIAALRGELQACRAGACVSVGNT